MVIPLAGGLPVWQLKLGMHPLKEYVCERPFYDAERQNLVYRTLDGQLVNYSSDE